MQIPAIVNLNRVVDIENYPLRYYVNHVITKIMWSHESAIVSYSYQKRIIYIAAKQRTRVSSFSYLLW